MLDYKAIGRKISFYRRVRDYTQAALAEKIDISESYMSQIECGRVELSLKRLDSIAETLKIDITMLLSDTDIYSRYYGYSELLDFVKKWTPEQKALLLSLVKCADESFLANKNK